MLWLLGSPPHVNIVQKDGVATLNKSTRSEGFEVSECTPFPRSRLMS